MVEGGITLVKYLLFLANFILWIGGLGLVVAGAVLQLKYTGLLDILGDERLATPVLLLAAGAFCALLGFLGCCGAIRENYCLTVSFAVLLALLLLLETAGAIAAYALHQPLQESVAQQLTKGLHRYNKSVGVATAWDQTQIQMKCCGVHNYSDWGAMVPESCCQVPRQGCYRVGMFGQLHDEGCIARVERWVMVNAALVGAFSALLGAMQVLGVCFACCLSKSILKDFHDYYY